MDVRILRAYMRDCERYGWTATLAGLMAYASEDYALRRILWTSDFDVREVVKA